MATIAPNAVLTSTPQCLFDRSTGVGVQAYDIASMPSITNLLAWANQEWRNCSSGPVKPLGVSMAAYLASNASAAAAGSSAATAAAAAAAASLGGGPTAVIAAPPTFVPTSTAANYSARVTLNATGSTGSLVRPILLYNWVVRHLPSGAVAATASGKVANVLLPASVYAAYLTATDIAGAVGNATKVFAVWPTPVTAAVIGSPGPLVVATDGDATQVWSLAVCALCVAHVSRPSTQCTVLCTCSKLTGLV